jgi:uroporphyrinogen-III synthase
MRSCVPCTTDVAGMTEHRPLSGVGVLVTRPAGQAEPLCRLIEAAGGRAIALPAATILPASDPEPVRALLGAHWDLMIFVSRNAVEQAIPLLPGGRLPSDCTVAAVGQATASALSAAGREADLVPGGRFDSEALLAMDALEDVLGFRVLIVRGVGGRATLGETLAKRGAHVAYAEVYRRDRPQVDPAPLVAHWQSDIQAVTATSDDILQNLMELFTPNGRDLLVATPLVVVSERTADLARALGFGRIEVAERAGNEEILAALCRAVHPPEGLA